MIIKKLFYVEMEIKEDGLSGEDVEEIANEVDFSECDIDEMIQDRIKYYNFEKEVSFSVHDAYVKEGKTLYDKIVDTNFEKGYITLQPTEIESV